MTPNFIFVFILLTTFTIINATLLHKRVTFFGLYPNIEDIFSITMSPNPLISLHLTTITITGEKVSGASVSIQPPSVFPVCNSTDCSILTETKYIQTVTFLLNAILPLSYQIVLTIGNLNSSSPQMLFLHNIILACAMTTVS
ncbi:16936_t:CDS:2 [Gigaspora margarita]|uniref:16936_t:CDS:1 n=1 Tax=Gigaspora margarita TaxID=4874 RepID=A0ABN7VIU3_GIGMA|nr:16936_t:CDS:2 [Gigaspora margarita]